MLQKQSGRTPTDSLLSIMITGPPVAFIIISCHVKATSDSHKIGSPHKSNFRYTHPKYIEYHNAIRNNTDTSVVEHADRII